MGGNGRAKRRRVNYSSVQPVPTSVIYMYKYGNDLCTSALI